MWDFTDDKEVSFEPVPAGVYNMIVSDVGEKLTQKGDKRFNMTFTITEGEYTGRKIFEGYQMTGSEKSVQIGRGQLKALLKCAGKSFNVNGPEDFLNIEIAAAIKVQPEKDGYAAKNAISNFKPKTKAAPTDAVPF